LTAPDGQCDPGYYCIIGSWTSQPADQEITKPDGAVTKIGGLCTPGTYCVKGSTAKAACDKGTYNAFPGMRSASDCIACTPGYYCANPSEPKPTGQCAAGYFCIGGAETKE
jgi:hypothetical protein